MSDIRSPRPFGSTGLRVTPLAIGTSGWSVPDGEPEQRTRLERFAREFFAGGLPSNLLDTSNIYGASRAEEIIGAALGGRALSEGLVLQTKLDRDLETGDFGGDQMWRSLEQSLTRLGVDEVQVLYLHDPQAIGFDASVASGGPLDALMAMKRQGIARTIGISGGPIDMMIRFVETGVFDAVITHNRFTLVDRSAEPLLELASRRGLGILNAAPYGAGALTGDPRFSGTYAYRPVRPATRRAVERMAAACAEAGVPLAAAALQFGLRDPRIHGTVVGVRSRERLRETVELAEADVPEGLWAELDRLAPDASNALDLPEGGL